jgi:hypothetical protein
VIVFDLKCVPAGHVFEGWFGSSADYEGQAARGLVACPLCGSTQVAKAPMAPRVASSSGRSDAASPEAGKAILAELARLQRHMLEGSESVGDRFPDEARSIHLGEAEARAIHGRATRAEAESLAEDGIKVAPLLFPVRAPGEEN